MKELLQKWEEYIDQWDRGYFDDLIIHPKPTFVGFMEWLKENEKSPN